MSVLQTKTLFATASILALLIGTDQARANPTGAQVEAGTVSVDQVDPSTVEITQGSERAIINWDSFNIGTGETTRFVLPNAESVTLNRDFSGVPSEIYGRLESNGQLFLVNQNGILFGRGSQVDVAGLVATTHDIASADFMAGNLDFTIAGDPAASVINEGQITVRDLGFGAFVAPHVRNDGAIVAHLGRVEMASASGFKLDLHGDRLISFLIENPNEHEMFDANGRRITALVENSGTITADGGHVVLSAAATRGVVDSVINMDGIVQANSVSRRGGNIVLGGGSSGVVRVTGHVRAGGNDAGEVGGVIEVTGEHLFAGEQAWLDVAGQAGGGRLLFGGDYLGGRTTNDAVAQFGIGLEDRDIPTSASVFIADGARLSADALTSGDGGKLIVWSDGSTFSFGDITARGGSAFGNGGFIETSGAFLHVEKPADASAPNGTGGRWLLDPINISIRNVAANINLVVGGLVNFDLGFYDQFLAGLVDGGPFIGRAGFPTAAGSVVRTSDIEAALNAGTSVEVTTRFTVGGEEGRITLEDDITKTAGGDAVFALTAAGDVRIDPGVDITSTAGRLYVSFQSIEDDIIGRNIGRMALNGGGLALAAADNIRLTSDRDMPRMGIVLDPFNRDRGGRSIDVRFGRDEIDFQYDDTTAYLRGGAVSLLSNRSQLVYINFNGRDQQLSDRAIEFNSSGGWIFRNFGSVGVLSEDFFNGIPEVIWAAGSVSGPGELGEPPQGVLPLLEASSNGGRNITGYFATSSIGRLLLDTLQGPISSQFRFVEPASASPPIIGPIRPTQRRADSALRPSSATEAGLETSSLGEGIDLEKIEAKSFLNIHYGNDFEKANLIAKNADYMSLSSLAYDDLYPSQSVLNDTWQVLDAYNIDVFGGTMSATLFTSVYGEIVLAFRGTNTVSDPLDWINNLGAPANLAQGQSREAISLALILKDRYPQISFVGHSLGGRLAQVAAESADSKAIVFDSSPLSTEEAINSIFARGQNVIGFRAPGDPVSGLSAIGDIEVENYPSGGSRHSHRRLAEAMQEVKRAVSALTE